MHPDVLLFECFVLISCMIHVCIAAEGGTAAVCGTRGFRGGWLWGLMKPMRQVCLVSCVLVYIHAAAGTELAVFCCTDTKTVW